MARKTRRIDTPSNKINITGKRCLSRITVGESPNLSRKLRHLLDRLHNSRLIVDRHH
ncbi:hypothetical protein GCM10009093_12220 [Brevundimonas terrae]|uniref:Uncharacterized protein n=1 Tax=Brevundimonas terrae TaxID=363631 RepID=A0ABN0Y8E9_9CAUL